MGQNPIDGKMLTRAGVAGIVLAVLGIALFVGIWVLLDDVNAFPRLFAALCIPPGIIAIIVGGFFLMTRSKPPQ